MTAWHEGAEAAVAAFQAEEVAGNSGFSRAKRAVEEHFVSLDQLAPARAVQFLYGDSTVSGSQGRKVMEDLVTIGRWTRFDSSSDLARPIEAKHEQKSVIEPVVSSATMQPRKDSGEQGRS